MIAFATIIIVMSERVHLFIEANPFDSSVNIVKVLSCNKFPYV
jgi:hypothetical protein